MNKRLTLRKFIKQFPCIVACGVLVFLLTFMVNNIVVNASSVDLGEYFPCNQNDNDLIPDVVIDAIMRDFDSDNYYIFCYYSSYSNHYYYVGVMFWPKSSSGSYYAEVNNDKTAFSIYRSGVVNNVGFRRVGYNDQGVLVDSSYISIDWFQDKDSSLYNSDCSYISNFILKTSSSNDASVVLRLRPIGHQVKPPRDQEPEYSSGDSEPTQVPVITNFTDNFLFLGKTIQYYGNLINSQLNDIKNFLYDNFMPLIVTFTVLYNYGLDDYGNFSIPVLFSTLFVPSSTDVITVLLANDSLDFIPLVNAVFSKEVTIINQIHNLTPAKTFHVPSLIYHGVQIGNFDIDFSWFEPYKSYSDTVISVFLVLGWLYWLLVSVSHLLRGIHGQGESVTAADNYAAGWHYDL